jgi:hypothetical protein
MHRIDADGHASNLFTDGNPGLGVEATGLDTSWPNDVQEELCNLIDTKAGITLAEGPQPPRSAALDLATIPPAGRLPLANALALINTLLMDLAAFSGMEMENMTRGHGWRFLDVGRRLERGMHIVNLLCAGLSPEVKTTSVLEPLLEGSYGVATLVGGVRGVPADPTLAAWLTSVVLWITIPMVALLVASRVHRDI